MACNQCGGPTKKSTMKFCSRDCKIASQRGKREPLDSNKNIKCKIDGKIFEDYLNRSGALTVYSKNTLNKSFDWDDWDVIDVDVKEQWHCSYCEWSTVDIENKSGWITTHLNKKHNLQPEGHCQNYPEDKKLWIEYWKHHSIEVFKQESEDNRVQCLECGEYFRRINYTHLKLHEMTMEEYDNKYPHATRWSNATLDKARSVYYSETGLFNSGFDSAGQIEMNEFVQSMGFQTKKYRTANYEIDIFVPDKNIGFEYNGLFHHSEFRAGRGEKYHLGKTKSAEADGLRLIHIFDSEWNNKKSIIKSRITNLLGKTPNKLYAKNCEIKQLDVSVVREFLDGNHLQGYTNAAIALGLYHSGELVQCMTFGQVRSKVSKKEKDNGHYELIRMCTKLDYNVVGGAQKLLSFFETEYNPKLVVTYADRRWTSANIESIYDKLGFENVGQTDPCFWGTRKYTNLDKHRSFFTKKNMLDKYQEVFSGCVLSELTQAQMMDMIGYDRVWDCGNFKYIKKYVKTVDIPMDDEFEESDYYFLGSRTRKGRLVPSDDCNIKCELCGLYYPPRGMGIHLRYTHHTTASEYMEKYGEYRPFKLMKK